MRTSAIPSATCPPVSAFRSVTTPSNGAVRTCSIFIAVTVTEGQAVSTGQPLVTLEAMKMEHVLTAPFDGIVADLKAETGGQVAEGIALVRIVAEDAA